MSSIDNGPFQNAYHHILFSVSFTAGVENNLVLAKDPLNKDNADKLARLFMSTSMVAERCKHAVNG